MHTYNPTTDQKHTKRDATRGSHVGGDASDDDLFLPGGFDGGAEVGVIPGVDLSGSFDDGCVGVHVRNLLGQGPVGT